MRECTWWYRLLKRSIAGVTVRHAKPQRKFGSRRSWQAHGSARGVVMSVHIPSKSVVATSADPGEARTAKLEMLIALLVAELACGQIGYWAAFVDERGVSRYKFTTDPTYAELSPENAASRIRAVAALGRAIERYRGGVELVRSPAPRPPDGGG